jgi:hypothetical protein
VFLNLLAKQWLPTITRRERGMCGRSSMAPAVRRGGPGP